MIFVKKFASVSATESMLGVDELVSVDGGKVHEQVGSEGTYQKSRVGTGYLNYQESGPNGDLVVKASTPVDGPAKFEVVDKRG